MAHDPRGVARIVAAACIDVAANTSPGLAVVSIHQDLGEHPHPLDSVSPVRLVLAVRICQPQYDGTGFYWPGQLGRYRLVLDAIHKPRLRHASPTPCFTYTFLALPVANLHRRVSGATAVMLT